MASLIVSLARDAKSNFKQLFDFREERVIIIDEDGKEKEVTIAMQRPQNPLRLLAMLTWRQWLSFLGGWSAFFVDYLDFCLLAIQTYKLAAYYNTSKTIIASSITYSLLLRPVGAFLVGMSSDYFGRKYPLCFAVLMLAVFQVAAIHCHSLQAFLAVRALLGIAMGPVWGTSAAMAMEGCPPQARGLISGSEFCNRLGRERAIR
jgi:SHS family lactate transporter-like MFS transporter